MTWTGQSFSVGQILTAAQMTTLQADITALANGDSGAPKVTNAAMDSDVGIVAGTEQATTSGTSKSFSIPAGVKRVTAHFLAVSQTNANTTSFAIRLGDSGGIDTSGYLSGVSKGGAPGLGKTNCLILTTHIAAAEALSGHVTLVKESSSNHTWTISGVLTYSDGSGWMSAGRHVLTGELTTLQILLIDGSSVAFDAGAVNVTTEITGA